MMNEYGCFEKNMNCGWDIFCLKGRKAAPINSVNFSDSNAPQPPFFLLILHLHFHLSLLLHILPSQPSKL
jgi:hypothetical protein